MKMPLWAWRMGMLAHDWYGPNCVCTDCQEEGGGCDECPACLLDPIKEDGMKRWLVFAGDVYYPLGGWDDLVLATDDRDEAWDRAADYDKQYGWTQVVDTDRFEIAASFPKELGLSESLFPKELGLSESSSPTKEDTDG